MDRTQARAAALKLLYEWEMGGDGGQDTRLGLLDIQPDEREADYMEALVAGVMMKRNELDQAISKYLVSWTIDRLTRVDLTLLRIAAYEFLYGGIPGGIAANEAVELSREYSTEKAGAFINGVLGKLIRTEQGA